MQTSNYDSVSTRTEMYIKTVKARGGMNVSVGFIGRFDKGGDT